MTQAFKNMIIAWMAEAPSTTMDDIRILCSERHIHHPAEQIAKFISNKRNSENIERNREYERVRRQKIGMEKRRKYEETRTPEQIQQKCDSRKHQYRQPTPSAAGPAILVEHKLILEKYFCNVSRLPSLVECRALIARNQWNDLYSAHQIQKWFKNRRRREVKTGGRKVEISKRQQVVIDEQQKKYWDDYRDAGNLLLEPVQSSLVYNPIDPLSFDEPTLSLRDMHMPAMSSVEDEGVVDNDIFGNLEDIENVDLIFSGL